MPRFQPQRPPRCLLFRSCHCRLDQVVPQGTPIRGGASRSGSVTDAGLQTDEPVVRRDDPQLPGRSAPPSQTSSSAVLPRTTAPLLDELRPGFDEEFLGAQSGPVRKVSWTKVSISSTERRPSMAKRPLTRSGRRHSQPKPAPPCGSCTRGVWSGAGAGLCCWTRAASGLRRCEVIVRAAGSAPATVAIELENGLSWKGSECWGGDPHTKAISRSVARSRGAFSVGDTPSCAWWPRRSTTKRGELRNRRRKPNRCCFTQARGFALPILVDVEIGIAPHQVGQEDTPRAHCGRVGITERPRIPVVAELFAQAPRMDRLLGA